MSANPMSRRPRKSASADEPKAVKDTFKEVEYRKTSFTLEKRTHAQMKSYAALHEMSVGDLVHKAVHEYMERHP